MCKRFNREFLFFTLLPVVLFIFPLSSMAQEFKHWENIGIYGGTIYDIAIDPGDPNRVFAGSFMGDGVFLTEDGGNNWQPVEASNRPFREDTFKNHAVYAVKIAPGDSNVIWVAHDFWVEMSIDGGQTWTHISNNEMQISCTNCGGEDDALRICRSLVIDPIDPNIVYVGTSGPNHSYLSGTIYKTVDGGSTWEKIGFDDPNEFDCMVMDMDIDPQDPNIIWAVTNSEGDEAGDNGTGTLYRSDNSGESWVKIFPAKRSSSTSAFFTVAVKPNDSNTVFTGSVSGIRRHYREDNNDWSSIQIKVSENCIVRDITFDPQEPETIYTTWRDPQSEDPLPKFVTSTDGGKEWVPNTIELDPNKDKFLSGFLTLAVHPSNENIIFGGELNLGVYKSQDRGKTWKPINNGINAMIVNDIIIDPNDSAHILAGTHCGVYEKKQNKAWSPLTQEETTIVAFHPTNTQIFYAGVEGRLGKTTDGGKNWIYSSILDDGKNYVSSIAIDPADPNILFISVAGNGIYGRIYKSTGQKEDGRDWFGEPVLSTNYNFNVVAIDPSDSSHIFAGGGGYYDTNVVLGNLYESKKGGDFDTWDWDPNGLTDVIVNTVLIDPENPNIIYVGCTETIDKKTTFYRTMDGGDKWESSSKDMHREYSPTYGYNVWGASSDKIFVVGREGTIGYYYDGEWSYMNIGTQRWLGGIWGTSLEDIFVVGEEGTILRYKGDTWSEMDGNTTANLWNLWGASSNDVFAVGSNGTILHYNGDTWSPKESNTQRWLGGIWGVSSEDIFVVGEEGTILRYKDKTWSKIDGNTTENLWCVSGVSSDDVFAVGSNGTILHYDGLEWTAIESNTKASLWSICIVPDRNNLTVGFLLNNIFVVGSNGTILHYNGEIWSTLNSNTKENLMSVWGASSTEVFAASDKGTVLQYDGNTWTKIKTSRRRESSTDIWDFSQSDGFMPVRLRSSDHSRDKHWPTGEYGRVNRSSLTDLAFHPKENKIIYSSTMTNGIFVSKDQGETWVNLGILPYYVYSIAIGCVYAGATGGAYCDLPEIFDYVCGYVRDACTKEGIGGAYVVATGLPASFKRLTKSDGIFLLNRVARGTYDFTVTAEGYIDKKVRIVLDSVDLAGVYDPHEKSVSLEDDIYMQSPRFIYDFIQPQINNADSGEIINIEPGIYCEKIDLTNINITLRSIDPTDPNIVARTVINGRDKGSIVNFWGKNNSVLSGFTLQNGHDNLGGGIHCHESSSPLISNCIIKTNSAKDAGGGLYSDNAKPKIVNTIMLNNSANGHPNQISLKDNSTTYSDIQIIYSGINEDAYIHRKDYDTGKWESYYRFFGKSCKPNDPNQCAECLFISNFP